MTKHDSDKSKSCWDCCGSNGIGFGVFLLLLGGFFLAQELGWIETISFWPIVLIGFGAYIILSKLTN